MLKSEEGQRPSSVLSCEDNREIIARMPFKLKNGLFYGWVIVIVFFIIQAMLMGIGSSFSVFFKSIEGQFDLTRTTTSAILSVSMILVPVFGFIGGWALDRYGPRLVLFFMGLFTGLSLVLTSQTNAAWQLFITYSFLLALGSGAIYVAAVSTVSRWFDKKRGRAVGIAGSGEGLGTVVMAPLSTYLMSRFGWQKAYLILGIIVWVIVVPLSQLLKKDPYEIGALPDGVRPGTTDGQPAGKETEFELPPPSGLSMLDTLKTGNFWLVVGIWFTFSFCMVMLFTHIVPHATDTGISVTGAAVMLSIMGGARAVGMILLGIVADKAGRKKVAIISTLFQAGAMVWLVWVREPWMFYLFAVIYGLGNGGLFSGVTSLLGNTFGLSRLGLILGMLEIGWGIGAAAGPVVGGLIFDTGGSYTPAFLLGAGAMAVIALFVALLKPETRGSA
jgi:MFS family permease